MTLKEMILKKAEFNRIEVEKYARGVTMNAPSLKFDVGSIMGGSRYENARLIPIIEALAEGFDLLEEWVAATPVCADGKHHPINDHQARKAVLLIANIKQKLEEL